MYPGLSIAGLDVKTYVLFLGLAAAVGLVVGPRWALRLEGLPPLRVWLALLLLGVAAFGGAHLHFAIRHWQAFQQSPVLLLQVWSGLYAAGAVAALIVAFPLVARGLRLPLGALADGLAPTIGLGAAVARLGCFLNACCAGRPCAYQWCVRFPDHLTATHPLQLYFLAAGLAAMAIAIVARRWRRFRGEAALTAGLVFTIFMAVLEYWRADSPGRGYWGGLPQHTWWAAGLVVILATTLIVARQYVEGSRLELRRPSPF